MTGILLCLAALALLSAALWLVLCREALVAAVWFKVFPARAWYPPEAAEVPDPVDEHFNTAPFFSNGVPVVAGDWTAELVDAYDRYRRGEDVFAGAVHEPSPEVKQ